MGLLDDFEKVRSIYHEPTLRFQAHKGATVHLTIPYIQKVLKELINFMSDDLEASNPYLVKGEAYHQLYSYFPMDDTDTGRMLSLYFASVLDPLMKLEYFRRRWFPDNVITRVDERFKDAYPRYKGVYNNKQSRGASHTSDIGVRRTRTQSSSEEAPVSLTLFSDDESSVAQVNEVQLYLSKKSDGCYKSVIEF